MTNDLINKYDLRVPRYTSYPTAPHFNEGVNGAVYKKWLSELPQGTPLSLYFHIPFCDEMCWFCGCYTKIVKRYDPVKEYLGALLAEIDLVADALPGRFSAKHLHWGGGSPTMLKGEDWLAIMTKLRDRFDVTDDAEVAVELDPRTATEDYVRELQLAGVNRASIGVQSYEPKVQEAINRIQPYETTKQVIEWLRAHDITRINMDLMYGLPFQDTAEIERMVDLTVDLQPNRIALFGYAHVPWMKSHQKLIKEETLPDAAERWKQFTLAVERLKALGYVQIGFDHFAHPDDSMANAVETGELHRNFQGYTTDSAPAMLGFGASAIGYLPQGYVQNEQPLKAYSQAIYSGVLPAARGIELSADDKLRRDIIERIMCDLTVDLADVCKAHDFEVSTLTDDVAKLAPLSADGICTVDDTRITVSEDGRPFVRLVASAFDAYLGSGQGRHSKAV
ncbi:oxygen-independent coproporphyrinogen III oxidase [Magnetovibrio blakemorei]|uniref:Coproporphyrinogen-III oxidase n=1 Tax=Magnetovibrio blakemorei TaxID=28181 RepID=A0A1E5QBF2_9PROT|nr:oxygen-independent coproporphyrinogen III oxidase [Magnetovibrio blakemorei]OEJ68917.1 oxygen-independent coproporphyrinogen III oxidase [Magnetovibrio blakemorei]